MHMCAYNFITDPRLNYYYNFITLSGKKEKNNAPGKNNFHAT